jgi:hypothetical protein
MIIRLATTTAVSLALSAGLAFAQTTTPTTGAAADTAAGASVTLPSDWDDTITNAFFGDGDAPALVDETEMATNWEALSDEQKEIVRSHCSTVDTAAAGSATGGAATTGSATTDTGSAGAAMDSEETDTAAGSSSTDTTAAAGSSTTTGSGAATGGATDSTAMSGSATTGTDSGTTASTTDSAASGSAGASAGASMEVAEADIEELCGRVMEMN